MKKYNKWLKKQKLDINGNIKYIHHTVHIDGVDYSKIHIGDKCVFSIDVILLVHDCSLEAGMNAVGKGNDEAEAHFIKDITIGNNVFVGARAIILPGANIGDNCIIGAGAVLSGKTYPENSIIVGNPARVIGNVKEWANKKINSSYIFRGYYN